MNHFGKVALRVTKNYTKGYSDTQAKVREATSNDPWGPSGTQMNDIAQLTYNQNDFIEIMEMLDKRLNDKGKNWRHVFKSLTVLDYCLHQGSENVVIYFRDNIYIIKTLKEFQYIDEDGKDQGANVRQKAKDITNLLQDEDRLREERRSRAHMRDRMIRGAGGEFNREEDDENALRREGKNGLAGKRPNRDEDELRKAIEESKRSLAQEMAKKEQQELEAALKASEEEELKRRKDVDDSNERSLFDDSAPSNNTNLLIDPTPYAVGLQPQFTSIQPQMTLQPQFTSFNPYQQQLEQQAAQQEYLRQQELFLLQQQQAQQQQQQQEEWMRQQMLQQQMAQQQAFQMQQQQQAQSLFTPTPQLTVQPTGFGSNNPFAQSSPTSPQQFSPTSHNPPSFNLSSTYENHNQSSNLSSVSGSPRPTSANSNNATNPYTQKPIQVKVKKNEALEGLFANRDDGQDTFGNVGALRYGNTDAGRVLIGQQTGKSHNPFQQQQQQQQNNEKPFFDI
ncbi:hypothetical protein D9611_014361 [Ephemerocybe angulata]|uniref:ENTH domain-containing protein n=1 Tax=Ephemerocybe angulata TaxID=980116 RepID=A0A8H5B824_9AGAR|nr:hypothetical protein D9611_014361 [Tulosesus angulatus]